MTAVVACVREGDGPVTIPLVFFQGFRALISRVRASLQYVWLRERLALIAIEV